MTEITSRLSTSHAIESHLGESVKATVYLVEDLMHWEITLGDATFRPERFPCR